jgi:hypothetical protein
MECSNKQKILFEKMSKLLEYVKIIEQKEVLEDNKNWNKILCSLVLSFFTGFKYKLQISNHEEVDDFELSKLRTFINDILIAGNSKYIILEETNFEEIVNFILYFICEFNYLGSLLEKLNKINKKYIQLNLETILKTIDSVEEPKTSVKGNITQNKFLSSFTKLNFQLKSLNKQIESFINLSYKLNERKNLQNTPER